MRITAVGYRARISMAMPFFVRNMRQNTAPKAERIRDLPGDADISCRGQTKNRTVKTPKNEKRARFRACFGAESAGGLEALSKSLIGKNIHATTLQE